jgi:hypothetical protein
MTADGAHVGSGRSETPLGHYPECDADALAVRRPDGSTVATFAAGGAGPFGVEAAVWEDAD